MAGAFFKQTYFIPKPTLTEENLPDQSGKVRISLLYKWNILKLMIIP